MKSSENLKSSGWLGSSSRAFAEDYLFVTIRIYEKKVGQLLYDCYSLQIKAQEYGFIINIYFVVVIFFQLIIENCVTIGNLFVLELRNFFFISCVYI